MEQPTESRAPSAQATLTALEKKHPIWDWRDFANGTWSSPPIDQGACGCAQAHGAGGASLELVDEEQHPRWLLLWCFGFLERRGVSVCLGWYELWSSVFRMV